MDREPIVILVAGLVNIIQLALALAVSFGLSLTEGQTAAIMALATALTNMVIALWARSKVTPVSE